MTPRNKIVTLTTDFGSVDPFVGVMKGMILKRAPGASMVDLTHEIEPQNILQGYYALFFATASFPEGTVHLAVIDPGVGGLRRPLVIESGGSYFVGPDNGLFSFVLKEKGSRVFSLAEKKFHEPKVSATFHGRDIFAPVTGHLLAGVEPEKLGPEVEDPIVLDIPSARVFEGEVAGEIVYEDRFGNLITNIAAEMIKGRKASRVKVESCEVPLVSCYGEGHEKELRALINSWGVVELFVKKGRGSEHSGLTKGTPLTVPLENGVL